MIVEGEFTGIDAEFGTITTLDGKKYRVEFFEKHLID